MLFNFQFKPKFFETIKTYNRQKFMADLMAGTIVGIVALPLAIAFGIASGVSPEQGLKTAIIAGFVISFLGGSSVQIGGPTGAFIVIVYGIVQQYGIEGLMIATLLAGVMLVLMGVFKLGTVIKFIPYPVVIGFTSGIAVTIFSTQIKDLFGLQMQLVPADFVDKWIAYFQNFSSTNLWALGIGLLSIVVIIFGGKLIKKIPGSLIAIIGMTVIAYFLREYGGITVIETIGDRFTINAELPTPHGLNLSMDLIIRLLPPAFTIALLGSIESLLSATVADGVTGDRHNANTELVGQGVANILSPLFGGIPATGAIARTMTNINNGGRTPVAGMIHAVVLLLILLFLGPLTAYIPMACLAGVLVVVAYNMSEWRTFKSMLSNPKSDVGVLLTTFLLTVFFDLTIAIEVGLLLALLLLLKRLSETSTISIFKNDIPLSDIEGNPTDEVLHIEPGIEVYEIEGPFFFGIASKFDEATKLVGNTPKIRIIRLRKVPFIDSSGIHNLENLIRMADAEGIQIILSGVNPKVHRTLKKAGINARLGEEFICSHISIAVEKANSIIEK
ncbi:MAG: sulfate permease, partial [Paludibacteraceae bacterium]|nr:sulfate permease [Paludibacteraceae bacterium]